MRFIVFFALVTVGCALTADERRAVVDEAARMAGDFAHQKAIAAGMGESDAQKVAEAARVGAAEIATRALPKAEDAKRRKFGAAVAAALLFLVQLASAAMKTGVPA